MTDFHAFVQNLDFDFDLITTAGDQQVRAAGAG